MAQKALLNWDNPSVVSDTNTLKPWFIHAIISIVTVLAIISSVGTSIINSSMAGELYLGQSVIIWVNTSFLMMLGVCLPVCGWLAEKIGFKRVFCLGVIIFSVSSAGIALSQNATELILFRILEGTGSALVFPVSLAILAHTFAPKQVPMAISLYVTIGFGLGIVLGFVLAGWIGQYSSWQMLFWINPLLGLPCLIGAIALFKETPPKVNQPPFDIPGFIFFSGFLVAALVLINSVKAPWNTKGWYSNFIYICYGIGGISLICFFVRQYFTPAPLLNLSLFKVRPFTVGCTILAIAAGLMFGTLNINPLILENVLQYDKITSGILMSSCGVGLAVMGLLASLMTRFINVRYLTIIGLSVIILSCYLSQWITIQTENYLHVLLMLLRFCGVGLALGPVTSLALMELTKEDAGQGAVTATFFRQMGAAFGSSILTIIINSQFAFHNLTYGSQMDISSPAYEYHLRQLTNHIYHYTSHSLQEAESLAKGQIVNYIEGQAYISAINDAYMIAGVALSCAALGLILVMIDNYRLKKKREKQAHAAISRT